MERRVLEIAIFRRTRNVLQEQGRKRSTSLEWRMLGTGWKADKQMFLHGRLGRLLEKDLEKPASLLRKKRKRRGEARVVNDIRVGGKS